MSSAIREGAVSMTLSSIREKLHCEVLSGEERMDTEVTTIAASDGMSAVLASPCRHALLITGLANMQSVRTAHMADIAAVLYVRGVKPNEKSVELARQKGIVLLSTRLGMFDCCGLLYGQDVKGVT